MANDRSPFSLNRRQVLLGSAALALSATQLRAAELGGSRIEAIVPFGEGGGADSYIRYMARVLEKKLPGSPSIVIRNVPGGGSVVGANYFDKHAKTDGTTIALAST
jgi:tripartite-type tricarboxylate transporter receptor subunit TctC